MCICQQRYGKSKRLFLNSCGGNSVIVEWSTNGTNYNEFYNFVDTATQHKGISPSYIALSNSGYTESSDLYVRFFCLHVYEEPPAVMIASLFL